MEKPAGGKGLPPLEVSNAPRPGQSGHHTPVIDTTTLPGKTLVGHDGGKIGKITAVELDHKTGRSDFMKIRRGGFLGYGTEWFVEPINRITDVGNKTVTLG